MRDLIRRLSQRISDALDATDRLGTRLAPIAKGVAAALALGVILVVVSGPLTLAAPRTCASCHAPAAAYRGWKASKHGTVPCQSCHTDRAAFAGLGNSAALLTDAGRSLSGGTASDATWVANEACQRCHPSSAIDKPSVSSTGLRMSHRGLAKGGYRCVDCHASVAHDVPAARASAPTMSVCARCHNNVDVTGKCETCHTQQGSQMTARQLDPEWSKTHGPDWKKLHGMGELKTCTLCHATTDCRKCHGVPLPHDSTFVGTHGQIAVKNPQPCYVCHQRSFCSGCHGIEMPHPQGFLPKHSAEAQKPSASCMRCHQQANCDECHTAHIHPGGAGS